MERLTHERNNGIKTGYWSPNKKDELVSALAAYENTGLTSEQINGIATELKEYKQLGLSPKRLSEHVAFSERYRELFGAMDFNRIMELKERDAAKAPIKDTDSGVRYTDDYICPNCGKHFTGTGIAAFCYHCGQRLKWEE